jgi:gas vesicle protein GvpG
MGLFTGLLTLPLAPVRGVVWVADQLVQEAERELYDERNIRREMLALELAFEDGEIDELERRDREEELLQRLEISRARAASTQEEGPYGWQ